jgi:hypothetical protein
MELEIELLARHFGGDHPLGRVGDLVLGEMPRFGHRRGERSLELGDAVAGLRADEIGLVERQHLVELRGVAEQPRLVGDIDLVEDQDLPLGTALEAFDHLLDLGPGPALAVDHQRDQIGAFGALPGGGDHRAIEPALGREDAGRVDEDELRCRPRSRCPSAGRAWSAPWG